MFVGNSSNMAVQIDMAASGRLIVGNGVTVTSVPVGGDVTMDAAGAVTISDDAVEGVMLNTNTAGSGISYNLVGDDRLDLGGALTTNATITTTGSFDLIVDGAGNFIANPNIINLNSGAINVGDAVGDVLDFTGISNFNTGNFTIADAATTTDILNNTINIGNASGDNITLTGNSQFSGGTSLFDGGTVTVDNGTQIDINSNTINIGNAGSDNITATGDFTVVDGGSTTDILNDFINIGNTGGDAIDLTGTVNVNAGDLTVATNLNLATGTNVNEIIDSGTGIDFATPSDDALVTEAVVASLISSQDGSGLTFDLVGDDKIDLGGNLDVNTTIITNGFTYEVSGGDQITMNSGASNLILSGATIDVNGSSGVTIDGAGASNFTTSTGTLTLDGNSGVLVAGNGNEIDITSAGALVDVNGGSFEVDVASGISLDAGTASNLSTMAGALTLSGNGGVNVAGNGSEIDLTTTGAMIDANAGSLDVDVTGAINLDAGAASNLSTISGDIDISAAGQLDLDGGSTVAIDASTGVTIEASGGPISIGANANAQSINIGTGGAARTIAIGNSTGATAVNLDAGSGDVNVNNGDLNIATNLNLADNDPVNGIITQPDGIDLSGGASDAELVTEAAVADIFTSNLAGSGLTFDAAGNDEIDLGGNLLVNTNITTNGFTYEVSGGDQITLNGGASNLILAGNAVDLDGTNAVTIDAGAASNFTTSAGTLTLDGAGGINVAGNGSEIDLTSTTATVDLNAGSFDADLTGAITLDAGAASNLSTSAGNLALSSAAITDVDGATGVTIDAAANDVDVSAATNVDLNASATRVQTGTFELNDADAVSGVITQPNGIDLSGGASDTELVTEAAVADIFTSNLAGSGLTFDAAGNDEIDLGGNLLVNTAITTNGFTYEVSGGDQITLNGGASNLVLAGAIVDVDGASGVTLDAAANDIDINSAAATVDIDGATGVTLDAAANDIDINSAAATVDIDGATGVTLDAAANDIDINSAAATVDIDGATGVTLDAAANDVDLTAAANVDLNATATRVQTGTFELNDADAVSGIITQPDGIDLSGGASDTELVTEAAVADIFTSNLAGSGLTFDAAGNNEIDLGGNLLVNTTITTNGFTYEVSGGDQITLNGGASNLVLGGTTVDIDGTSSVVIDGAGASNFSTSASNLALSSAAITDVDGATGVTIDATANDITLTAANQVILTGTGNGVDVTNGLDVSSGDLTLSSGTNVNNISTTVGTPGDDVTLITEAGIRTALDANQALPNGNVFIGSAGGVATAQAMGGDATIINDGTLTIANGAVGTAKMAGLTSTEFIIGTDGTPAGNTAVAMSGDATMVNTGALTIANGAVSTGKMAGLTSTEFIIGTDGTPAGNAAVALSGDATMDNAGALTIANDAVTTVKILDGNVTTAKMAGLTSTEFIIGTDGTAAGNTAVAMSGDATMDNAGALTIANDAVTTVKILDNNVTLAKIADGGVNQVLTTDGTGNPQYENKTIFATSVLTDGDIFVGDGTNVATGVTMSGDATMVNTGALTIANGAVSTGKMAGLTSTEFIIGTDGTPAGNAAVALSGDATMDNAGALTIANDAVTTVKILDDNVTVAKIAGTGNWSVMTTDGSASPTWLATPTGQDRALTWDDGLGTLVWRPWDGMDVTSDARLKTDLTKLQNSREKLQTLNGYNYYWKNKDLGPSLQYGVVAQEVEKLFPDLVVEGSNGYKKVKYIGLIPLLIEAIKEQQQLIDNLSASIERDESAEKTVKSELQKQRHLMDLQQQILDQLRQENEDLKKDMIEIKKELGMDIKASLK